MKDLIRHILKEELLKEEKVVNVLNEINRAGGILVRDVDLFDIYIGEGISQGRKNLAFHIIYQAENKTLTKEEIDNLQEKIIKVLEENGIGRPSTYAPTLSTVQAKNYIEKNEEKRFQPTEIGIVVNDLLVAHFPKIVDVGFTSEMEKSLDEIAQGEKEWVPVIKEFYEPFEQNLQKKYEEVSKKDITEKPTKKICPKCKAPLLIRIGRYGEFYSCSKFPECKYTESLKKNTLGIKCPKCKKGDVVEKRTKKGKIFYGCDQWPECDSAFWGKPTGEKCPECGSLLIKTKRGQIKCSEKECGYTKK